MPRTPPEALGAQARPSRGANLVLSGWRQSGPDALVVRDRRQYYQIVIPLTSFSHPVPVVMGFILAEFNGTLNPEKGGA